MADNETIKHLARNHYTSLRGVACHLDSEMDPWSGDEVLLEMFRESLQFLMAIIELAREDKQ